MPMLKQAVPVLHVSRASRAEEFYCRRRGMISRVRHRVWVAAATAIAATSCASVSQVTNLREPACARSFQSELESILVEQGESADVAARLARDTEVMLAAAELGPRPFLVSSPSGADYSFFVQRKSSCLLRLYGRQKGFTRYTNNLTYIATRSLPACACGDSKAAEPVPARASEGAAPKGAEMASRAKGTFEVTVTPQEASGGIEKVGRLSIEKHFHGDLEGTSRGEMLTGATDVQGSAGYVAIERVTGTLQGRRGSFLLQHTGTMDRGAPRLSITVIPDSGTEELAGLSGEMTIEISDGKHSYALDYRQAPANDRK